MTVREEDEPDRGQRVVEIDADVRKFAKIVEERRASGPRKSLVP